MSVVEIIAVVFSLLCVWFSIRKNVLNWPAGIIGVCAYLLLFYKQKLYADMVLQLFFIVQGFYGWYNWHKNKQEEHEVSVSYLTPMFRLICLLSLVAITIIWAEMLRHFTNASLPYLDAFVATTSFLANWLMARRKIENWILWITADIVYIGLFWYKGLYLSFGIYVLFLGMAIAGLIKWIQKPNTNTASL